MLGATELSESLSRTKGFGFCSLYYEISEESSDSFSLTKLDSDSEDSVPLLRLPVPFYAASNSVARRSIFFSVSVTCLWS